MIEDGSSVTFSYVSVLTPVLQTKPLNHSTRTKQTGKQTDDRRMLEKGIRKTGQEKKKDEK